MGSPSYSGDPYAPWWRHNIVLFDVETTGLGDGDRVVEVGFARFEDCKLVDSYGTLVFPEREIPDEATGVHGISTLDVSTAPRFLETLPQAVRISRGAWPCAYHATFDQHFLLMEMDRLGLDPIETPLFDPAYRWLDPLTWARYLDGTWGNKLVDACARYGISIESAHRAQDDAIAAGLLLFEGLRERLPNVTMTELLRRQAILDEKHAGEFRHWFRNKGIAMRR